MLASVFCELSTARSEHGAARRPLSGQLRQDPSPAGESTVTACEFCTAVADIGIVHSRFTFPNIEVIE